MPGGAASDFCPLEDSPQSVCTFESYLLLLALVPTPPTSPPPGPS
jgi:hypothetical protein